MGEAERRARMQQAQAAGRRQGRRDAPPADRVLGALGKLCPDAGPSEGCSGGKREGRGGRHGASSSVSSMSHAVMQLRPHPSNKSPVAAP